jgi:hypothetical protein
VVPRSQTSSQQDLTPPPKTPSQPRPRGPRGREGLGDGIMGTASRSINFAGRRMIPLRVPYRTWYLRQSQHSAGKIPHRNPYSTVFRRVIRPFPTSFWTENPRVALHRPIASEYDTVTVWSRPSFFPRRLCRKASSIFFFISFLIPPTTHPTFYIRTLRHSNFE